MFRTCSHEKELTQALKDGHWPQGCGPELRAHVDACGNCSDLVLVTQTFQHARSEVRACRASGSPSLLWWRAQLRRRNAATERVSRPITIAQTFAWFVVVLVGAVFVVSQYRHGLRWASWWSELVPTRAFHLLSMGSGQGAWNLLLLISGLRSAGVTERARGVSGVGRILRTSRPVLLKSASSSLRTSFCVTLEVHARTRRRQSWTRRLHPSRICAVPDRPVSNRGGG